MIDASISAAVLMVVRNQSDGMVTPLGTCFAVGPSTVATAAHAIGPSDEGLQIVLNSISSINDYQDTTNSQIQCVNAIIKDYDPVRDVAILEISSVTFRFSHALGGSDFAPPGTSIISVGYPHADQGRNVLTLQTSVVGARVLLGNAGSKQKHLVLNTQTRPGQSGGPVFSLDGRTVVGMVVGGYAPKVTGSISLGGIDPQTLHQTTHAVSAEYIKDML